MSDTTAITADDFLGTLGVNTHISNAGPYSNISMVEQDLEYLGVGIDRDTMGNGGEISVWQQVAQATGVKFDFVMPQGSPAADMAALALVPQMAADGILASIEGGDEEDDPSPQAAGNSLSWTAQFQQQVAAMGQQNGLPVINMSFGAGWTGANNWVGDYPDVGDLSAYANYANAHTYPNVGQLPNNTIEALNADAQMAAWSQPVITTEIGWQTSLFNETQIAQYAVDATFDGIADGDAGMYFYGLYDDSTGDWGLFNSDGSPRPAANALHNLTTLLADPGGDAASFSPGSLNYSLAGEQSSDNSILIETSNGAFWIGLWNEGGNQHTVTVNLPSAAAEVEVFDPITGTSAIQSAGNTNSVSVSLGADPLLIEVLPNGSSGTTSAGTGSSDPSSSTAGSDPSSAASSDPTATAGGATGTPTDLAVSVPGSQTVAAAATQAISGVSVSDAWAAGSSGNMALNVWDTGGTLTIDGQTFGPGNGAASYATFSGSLAQINADLANMTYTAAAGGGADTITVDVWNQAGVEVQETIPVSGSDSGAAGGGANAINIAANNADPLEIVNNAAITATAGDHMLFIGGTGNTVTLSGGTDTVQAFQGGNTITTTGGNDTVQIAGSGNVVNATGGSVTIDDSGNGNTIALPGAGSGYDDIFGYVLQNGDTLDLSNALAATTWNGTEGTLGNYLSVSTSNNSAVISLSPTGSGGGSAIATLQQSGPETLAGLLQHAIT